MKRIAVTGIDGSGKTTLVRRLVEATAEDTVVLSCPAYHETAGVPLADLSHLLDRLSRYADKIGNPALKTGAMYLQMTLFGPVADQLIARHRPRFFVSEHHPIIDSLAYAPLYTRVASGAMPKELEPGIREALGHGFDSILEWHREENHRLSQTGTFWELSAHVARLFTLPLPKLLTELERTYRTPLPDILIYLDIPVEIALARLAERSGTRELHESPRTLEALRGAYTHMAQQMRELAPMLRIFVIDTRRCIDETLEEVLEQTRIAHE